MLTFWDLCSFFVELGRRLLSAAFPGSFKRAGSDDTVEDATDFGGTWTNSTSATIAKTPNSAEVQPTTDHLAVSSVIASSARGFVGSKDAGKPIGTLKRYQSLTDILQGGTGVCPDAAAVGRADAGVRLVSYETSRFLPQVTNSGFHPLSDLKSKASGERNIVPGYAEWAQAIRGAKRSASGLRIPFPGCSERSPVLRETYFRRKAA